MKKKILVLLVLLVTTISVNAQAVCRRIFREEHTTWTFPGRELKALVSIPAGEGPFPVIMAIHGGGFTGGSSGRFDSSMHQHFLDLEIAFVSVEYRLVIDGGAHPTAIRDCLHNLYWLKDHAIDLKINPERVAVLGSSAGAYLAMMVGLTCNLPDYQPDFGPYQGKKTIIQAVISNAAMYDWMSIKQGDPYIKGFRDDKRASPVNLAAGTKTKAFLLIGGEEDINWSPSKPAAEIHQNLKNAGVHSELYLRVETAHEGLYEMDREYVEWAIETIVDGYRVGNTTNAPGWHCTV